MAQLGALGRVHLGSGLREAWRSRGALPPSQCQWEAALPAEPSIPVAPASLAGSLGSVQAAICFPTLVFSWSCCYLQFGFLLQTALPEGPLQRPVSTVKNGGQRSGGREGGCLSSLPSVYSSFWVAVAASLADPDGHTSSVCWSPPTHHGSARQTHYQRRLLASHTRGSSRRKRLLTPTSPPSSHVGAGQSPTPSCPLSGVPTWACVHALEKELASFLRCCPIQEGTNFLTTVLVH